MQATEADEILAAALQADAEAHERGRYDTIAAQYDDAQAQLLPIQDFAERRFAIGCSSGMAGAMPEIMTGSTIQESARMIGRDLHAILLRHSGTARIQLTRPRS